MPRSRKVDISLVVGNFVGGTTVLRWITHAIADCPMKIVFRQFAESLGEQEAAFSFFVNNKK
jgi:hypothetical protein